MLKTGLSLALRVTSLRGSNMGSPDTLPRMALALSDFTRMDSRMATGLGISQMAISCSQRVSIKD